MELSDIVKRREEMQERELEEKKVVHRDMLIDFISTKIRTAFIGALAAFEENFGEMWGHNEFRLTEAQEELRKEWNKTRKEILDKGNDQIKAARTEIEKYETRKVYR